MADVFASNKPDIIIHLATCYRKYHTATDISEMISTNIDLPTQIAQLAVQHGVKYYINTGTFFEYDFSDTPLQETSREQAFNLYASTKQAFNNVLKYYTEQYDFRALTIRLFSPYGPGDNEKFIPVVIRSLEKGMEMSLVNSTQRLNFTYVEDIVDAYMLAIDKIAYLKNSYEIINVAPSESTSLIDVIRVLEQIS
jgi:nucleoside-diphosphate-sugar epimerase